MSILDASMNTAADGSASSPATTLLVMAVAAGCWGLHRRRVSAEFVNDNSSVVIAGSRPGTIAKAMQTI